MLNDECFAGLFSFLSSLLFPSLSKNAQAERNVRQACLNGIAEAQPLFCKERASLFSLPSGSAEERLLSSYHPHRGKPFGAAVSTAEVFLQAFGVVCQYLTYHCGSN